MNQPTEIRTTQVNLPGLMKVLGKNLYSTPAVAIRELVQNAHDSCVRRSIEADGDVPARISVFPEPAKGLLRIVDTGAGLTREEIIRDLATVGSGYTSTLRDAGRGGGVEGTIDAEAADDAKLIGYFGLGFLSAFFVSDKVEVHSTSYQDPTVGWRFSSRGGTRYQISGAPARPVGTEITLHLTETFKALGDVQTVETLLRRYCCLLPLPVHLGHSPNAVNRPAPPWRTPSEGPVRDRQAALDFAERFEPTFSPLCTLPIVGDGPAEGLLWIQDGASYGHADNRHVAVFVRGMLVSEDARDLLPPWAGFCGGVVASDTLTPTASRETLREDETHQAVAEQVRTSLIEGLAALPKRSPAVWRRILTRHNEALIGAALSDSQLFDLLADDLRVPTTEGDLPLAEVLRRSDRRLHVSLGEGGGYEEVLFRALKVPVINGRRYGALPFAERYAARHGGLVVRLGTKAGDAAVFPPADVSDDERARIDALFGAPGRAIMPTRFAPSSLPAVLVVDQDAALKARVERDDADARISSAILGLARRYTAAIDGGTQARLYLNLDAPLMQRLLQRDDASGAAAAQVVSAIAGLFAGPGGDEDAPVDAGAAFEALSGGLMTLLGAR